MSLTNQDPSKRDLQHIAKLNGQDDWPLWIKQIKNYLTMSPQGFVTLLEFQKEPPTLSEGEEQTALNKRLLDWNILRIQAFATVDETCGSRASGILAKSKEDGHTVLQLFKDLEVVFKGKGSGRYAILVNQLGDLTLAAYKDVPAYGAAMIKIRDDMVTLNKKAQLPECYIVQLFIKGLGPLFESFRDSFSMQYEVLPDEEDKSKEGISLSRCIVAAEEFQNRHKQTDQQLNYSSQYRQQQQPGQLQEPKPCATCRTSIPHRPGQVCWEVDDTTAPAWWKTLKKGKQMRDEVRKNRQNKPTPLQAGSKRDSSPSFSIMGHASKKPDHSKVNVLLGGTYKEPELTNGTQPYKNAVFFKSNKHSGELMAVHRGINLWDAIILDSGASGGLVGRKDLFITYETIDGQTANGIGGAKLIPTGQGTIEINCRLADSNNTRLLRIPNVQYSPTAGVNLLSLNEMWPFIDEVHKPDNKTFQFKQRNYVFQATIKGGLMVLDTVNTNPNSS